MSLSVANYSNMQANSSQNRHSPTNYNWAYLSLYSIPALTVWGNVLVCVSVFVESRLRSRFNSFLVSLAISDLLCAVLVMPVSALKMIHGGMNRIPRNICLVWYSLDVFFTSSTIIHLCTISIDRYFALNNPLKYHRQKRKSALVAKILCAWLIPFSIAGPLFMFALWLDKTDEDSFKGCGPHNAYFIIIATVVTFYLPLLIMTVTYVLTVSTIIEQTKNARDLNASLLPLVVRPSAQAFGLKQLQLQQQQQQQRKQALIVSRQSSMNSLPSPLVAFRTVASGSGTSTNEGASVSGARGDGTSDATTSSRRRLLSPSPSRRAGAATSRISLEPPLSPIDRHQCSGRHSSERHSNEGHSSELEIGAASSASVPTATTEGTAADPQCQLSRRLSRSENGLSASCLDGASNEVSRLLRVPSRVSVCSMYSDDGMLPPEQEKKPRRRSNSLSSCDTRKKLSFTIVTENAKKTFKPATTEQKKRMDYIHRGSKAVQVLGILFGLFVACYLPFFIAYLVDYFCARCQVYTPTVVPILEWVAYSASMLNPIVYHFFNPTFRKTFHRLMRCRCQRYGSGKQPNYVFAYKIGRPA